DLDHRSHSDACNLRSLSQGDPSLPVEAYGVFLSSQADQLSDGCRLVEPFLPRQVPDAPQQVRWQAQALYFVHFLPLQLLFSEYASFVMNFPLLDLPATFQSNSRPAFSWA